MIEKKWASSWQNQQNDVWPAKTQISLGISGCPGWSESLLGAVILSVFSWAGSIFSVLVAYGRNHTVLVCLKLLWSVHLLPLSFSPLGKCSFNLKSVLKRINIDSTACYYYTCLTHIPTLFTDDKPLKLTMSLSQNSIFLHTRQGFPQFSPVLTKLIWHTLIRSMG